MFIVMHQNIRANPFYVKTYMAKNPIPILAFNRILETEKSSKTK